MGRIQHNFEDILIQYLQDIRKELRELNENIKAERTYIYGPAPDKGIGAYAVRLEKLGTEIED